MTLRDYNKKAYTDIMSDMLQKKNGKFVFTVSVHDGNLVEYTAAETVHYKKKNGRANTRVIRNPGNRGD